MTGNQILEKLNNSDINVETFVFGVAGRYIDNPNYKLRYIDGIGAYNVIEFPYDADETGPIYAITHFVDHDVYIRTEGHYTSYVGEKWENGFGVEVRPKEVIIKSWEEVK